MRVWVAFDLAGEEVYRHPEWRNVVRWAEKQGGDFAIAWLPSWGDAA